MGHSRPNMETSSPARPARARIGLVTKALGGETDPGSVAVNAAVRSAVEDMRTAGADVVEVEIPRTILTVMAKNSLDALTTLRPASRLRPTRNATSRRF